MYVALCEFSLLFLSRCAHVWREVGACTCVHPWSATAGALALLYCLFSVVWVPPLEDRCWGKPTKSELKPHYNHCDFNQGLALWPTYFLTVLIALQWRLALQNYSLWLTFTSYTCPLTKIQRILIPKLHPLGLKNLSLCQIWIFSSFILPFLCERQMILAFCIWGNWGMAECIIPN